MLKKCLSLFITGMILIAVGGIGIFTLAMNGLIDNLSINGSSESELIPSAVMPIEETQEITSLDLSADAGVFTVVRGESFSLETNLSTISCEVSDNCLKIENTASASFMNFNNIGAEITVTVPERQFDEVKIELNAGEFYADDIITDKLIIEMDAGEAVFNNISAISDSNITINAGECTFNNSILNDSEVNMDAGEMIFEECKLTGENDINLDFGEISMMLLGKRSDYELEINNDLGEVNVDGIPYLGEDVVTTAIVKIDEDGNTEYVTETVGTININLDLGECNIDFMEE